MRSVQQLLLGAYRRAVRTGLLDTAAGRAAFRILYTSYKRRFEARGFRGLARLVPAGSIAVDVGANIGVVTDWLAQWVGPTGQVMAIEPEPGNLRQLQRLIARRGWRHVVVVAAAAAEAAGTLHLAIDESHPGNHRIGRDGLAVAATTVDSLLDPQDIRSVSLIKIDVQGAELRVLGGAVRTLRAHQPAVVVELDDEAMIEQGASAGDVLDFLDSFGYRRLHTLDSALTTVTRAEALRQAADGGYVDVLAIAERDGPGR